MALLAVSYGFLVGMISTVGLLFWLDGKRLDAMERRSTQPPTDCYVCPESRAACIGCVLAGASCLMERREGVEL